MVCEFEGGLSGSRVPHTRGAVPGSCEDAGGVGRPRHSVDPVRVCEFEGGFPGLGIPHARCSVRGSCQDEIVVRRPRHSDDMPGVTAENVNPRKSTI